MIDASGNVGEIVWNELPAMTEDMLRRLERRLRQRTYPPTGTVHTMTVPVADFVDP